ncbi:MAG: energy-coupling factor transporter transmembrane protein EcfT [Proteobacteria bacterium]|nr:energy-coupling factor transporter transmembrane protein EcfT [Pseudomonadota bacterium]
MSLTLYLPRGGFFERIHPVVKLLALVVSFSPPFLGRHPWPVLGYLIFLVLAALWGRTGTNLARMWKLMIVLVVMSVVLWTLFQAGPTRWAAWGPLVVTREGLLYGLTAGLRLDCFIVAAIIFLSSTPIEDFTYALFRLGLPFAPSFALTLAFRLTPLFIETGQTIAMAQKARGLDLDAGGPIKKIRNHAPIIVPVLVSGLRRGDQLAMALESRGFGKTGRRTFLAHFRLGWRDGVLSGVLLLAASAMLIWGR